MFKSNARKSSEQLVAVDSYLVGRDGLSIAQRGGQWIRTVSDAEFDETCEFLTGMLTLEHFPAKIDKREALFKKTIKYLNTALTKLKAVNRSAASDWQGQRVHSFMYERLPQIFNGLQTELMGADSWDAKDAVDSIVEEIHDFIEEVDSMPVRILQSREQQTRDAANNNFTVFDEAADARLKELNELAVEAYKHAVSVEDKFTVEQAAIDYLPQSASLLNNFAKAADNVKGQATQLFFQQLSLIEAQLQDIIDRAAQDSLAQMQEHLMFLSSKQPNSGGDQQLQLEKQVLPAIEG